MFEKDQKHFGYGICWKLQISSEFYQKKTTMFFQFDQQDDFKKCPIVPEHLWTFFWNFRTYPNFHGRPRTYLNAHDRRRMFGFSSSEWPE